MINKYFQLIKKLRQERGFHQSEIAEKIGVSRTSYIAFEKGKKELSFSQAIKLAEIFGISLEDVESGLKPDFEKYKEMILFNLREAVSADGYIPKTKLAKILYLADFAYFYEKMKSMSGMQYRCLQYGPVPNLYFRALDELEESGKISIDHKGECLLVSENKSSKKQILDKISKEEGNLMKKIAKKWKEKNTREIVHFTHNQLPYKLCSPNEIIPYELIIQEDPDHVY
jgi:DNA-binding XRE family transcriptional regulator